MLFSRCLRWLPAALLALAACQSGPTQTQPATVATPPAATPTAAPAPSVASSPGTSYATYRGRIDGQPDSLTLHLVTTPARRYDNPGPSSSGNYYGPDGNPHEVSSLPSSAPDSLVLAVYASNDLDNQQTPLWKLQRRPDGSLAGTADGHLIRLRPVPGGSLTFAVRLFADSLAAFPGKAASPKARLSLQALVPVGGPAALADNVLRDERGDSSATQPVLPLPKLFEAQRDTFFTDYRADVKATTASVDEQPSAALNYEQQSAATVLFQRGDLLSLAFFTYEYTGGAHGMDNTTLASYDLRTGRRLYYADIFRPEAAARLPALLEAAVRPLVGLKPNEPLQNALLVSKMTLTRNVALTSGGVVFEYQPYEIASYAQGTVRVFLPLAQVRALLLPGLPLPEATGVAAR